MRTKCHSFIEHSYYLNSTIDDMSIVDSYNTVNAIFYQIC
jgi:hypothetical protein